MKKWASGVHIPFYLLDSSDHVSGKTGVSPSVSFSLNTGSWTGTGGGTTELGGGWYYWTPSAGDIPAPGHVVAKATGTGADDCFFGADLLAIDPLDPLRAGLTALPNAIPGDASGLLTFGVGPGQINPVDGEVAVSTLGDDSITSDSVDVSFFNQLFDGEVVPESYADSGQPGTLAALLYMIYACVAQADVTGVTLTTRRLDGSTPAGVFTLDSATEPTSRVRTS